MTVKFSAYLSIYNDWDILPSALRSVAAHVDELVVVDGAYEWMTPYLTMLGVNPARSNSRVYDAIEASGMPFRIISHIWRNEVEKRQAGYEACAHDYIYRIDADEVLFFNDSVLETALADGLAVGEMEMPNCVAPGWISCASHLPHIERQCFLFDRRRVSAQLHLNYLWLILTADTRPLAGTKPYPVFPQPLAFNAHLTAWRTPETGVNRAAFYMLNWMRQFGVPWLPALRDKPLADMQQLFDTVSPTVFHSSLSRGRTAFGIIEAPTVRTLKPTPLSADQETSYVEVYRTFLRSLSEKNIQATVKDQAFLTCQPTLLDLSSPAARDAISHGGMVSLGFSAPLLTAEVKLITYATQQPENEVRELAAKLVGTEMYVALPANDSANSSILRQCLEFYVWPDSPELSQTFRVLTPTRSIP